MRALTDLETRPVWAEVRLDYLAHNISEVRRITRPQTKVCAVIKADGYGHGAVQIGQTLLDHGADQFAVATLSEALQLRRAFPTTPILILGYTPENLADRVIESNLTQTLWDLQQAQGFNSVANKMGQQAVVHLKVDSGMSRVGFQVNSEGKSDVLACYQLENLTIEGVYTHFACADEIDKSTTHQQVVQYLEMIKVIESAGYDVPVKHVSNSAAIIDLPEYNFDMVRAGIMLYGLWPSPDVNKSRVTLKEVVSLKARLSMVKILEAGKGVSYGHIYKTEQNECIGTLPLGYADGFTRLLTGKAQVLVDGQRCDVVGKICMDQFMIKLPEGSKVQRGHVATLYGQDGNVHLTIDEVAQKLGTINYEIVCMLNKRVPKAYKRYEGDSLQFDDVLYAL